MTGKRTWGSRRGASPLCNTGLASSTSSGDQLSLIELSTVTKVNWDFFFPLVTILKSNSIEAFEDNSYLAAILQERVTEDQVSSWSEAQTDQSSLVRALSWTLRTKQEWQAPHLMPGHNSTFPMLRFFPAPPPPAQRLFYNNSWILMGSILY